MTMMVPRYSVTVCVAPNFAPQETVCPTINKPSVAARKRNIGNKRTPERDISR